MSWSLRVHRLRRHSAAGQTDYGIGIIGCGGIVNYAHLPAYRKAGPASLHATTRIPKRPKTAREHDIPRVAATVDEILDDPEIDIVDIAVTPWAQAAIANEAIAAGKHVLCQKPLADTTRAQSSWWISPSAGRASWQSTSRCAGTPASPSPGS